MFFIKIGPKIGINDYQKQNPFNNLRKNSKFATDLVNSMLKTMQTSDNIYHKIDMDHNIMDIQYYSIHWCSTIYNYSALHLFII